MYGIEEYETIWQVLTVRDWNLQDAALDDAARQARALVRDAS